jgi:Fe-Mn family superoxide dismutase
MSDLSRRRFLRTLGATVTGLSLHAGAARSATAPKESGLANEGLLAGQAGFQPRTLAPLPHAALPGFLSRAQLASHHAEYARMVEQLQASERALQTSQRDAAPAAYADLRRKQVVTANDVLLHELYFHNLAAAKMAVPRYVERNMREHMGSLADWAADFTLCAQAARAWAALVYDPYDDRWHNTVMDSALDGVWIGANPLIVCDVSEHAYRIDYRDRQQYIDKFLGRIDWEQVAARYRRVDRM